MTDPIVAKKPALRIAPDPGVRLGGLQLIAQALLNAHRCETGRVLIRLDDLSHIEQRPYKELAKVALNSLFLPTIQEAHEAAAQACLDLDSFRTGDAITEIDLNTPRGSETLARAVHIVRAYLNALARS